jgi:uncharacterized repeat protein (TIGR02543 family)
MAVAMIFGGAGSAFASDDGAGSEATKDVGAVASVASGDSAGAEFTTDVGAVATVASDGGAGAKVVKDGAVREKVESLGSVGALDATPIPTPTSPWSAPTPTTVWSISTSSGNASTRGAISQSTSVSGTFYEEYRYWNGQTFQSEHRWQSFNLYGIAYEISLQANRSYGITLFGNTGGYKYLLMIDSQGRLLKLGSSDYNIGGPEFIYDTGNTASTYYLIATSYTSYYDNGWTEGMAGEFQFGIYDTPDYGVHQGKISGTVKIGGQARDNVAVTLYKAYMEPSPSGSYEEHYKIVSHTLSGYIGSTGYYEFRHLESGAYLTGGYTGAYKIRVDFYEDDWSYPVWYGGSRTMESSTPIPVPSGESWSETANIDYSPPQGEISGTVRDATGGPIDDAEVEILRRNAVTGVYEYYTHGWTGSDGSFSIPYIEPGIYKVSAYFSGYTVWYGGGGGAEISMGSGAISGIDITLTPPQGKISGTVIGPSGAPVEYARLRLFQEDTETPGEYYSIRGVGTSANGAFSFPYLAPGNYKVAVWEYAYGDVVNWNDEIWYGGADEASASVLPIGGASSVYQGLIIPVAPGSVSGTVAVAFDANGGAVGTTSAQARVGQPYGSLPTPSRSGHTFNGWFTAASGGAQVTATTVVTNGTGHTLYAHWTAESSADPGTGEDGGGQPATTETPVPFASIPAANAPIAPGQASVLPKSVTFADGTSADVTWSSSDSKVATIGGDGKLVAAGEGRITLTATATDGSGRTQTITVTIAKPVTKVRTPIASLSLTKGANVAPPVCADSVNQTTKKADTSAVLEWSSSNAKVATVNKNTGKIKAVKTGKTTITATALNGTKLTVKVNVVKKAAALKKFAVSGVKTKLGVGKTAQLKLKLTPVSATNLSVRFGSGKSKIVSVDKAGKLTALKKGKAKITVTVGKKKYSKTITVK